jgi:hypothetical protein
MHTKKLLPFLALSIFLLLYSEGALTESAEVFKKEQEIVRVQMVQLSRELGVTCTECHSAKNWKDSSKATFKIAKSHLKTVELLRSNGFNGKKFPEASCFMCHQGHLKFASRMQHPEGSTAPVESKPEH